MSIKLESNFLLITTGVTQQTNELVIAKPWKLIRFI